MTKDEARIEMLRRAADILRKLEWRGEDVALWEACNELCGEFERRAQRAELRGRMPA